VGFWWTASTDARRAPPLPLVRTPEVDVFVPVYGEPVEVVEPTVALATAMDGANVRVHLLDDGGDDEMEALARRAGAVYHRRPGSAGAKAGNINAALHRTSGEFVVILDCDHVPSRRFLTETLGHMSDERVAFVQTPQYYANHDEGPVARAAWGQQALFFGAIARGKGNLDSIFCCGTNVLFRRAALEQVGGFPTHSVTEDFELSVELHQRGWRSVYVPEVLARGLGPEDMASYVSQQQRWARGCLAGARSVFRARLPRRVRAQYLLSSMYFLSGWTLLIYMSFPVIRILTGAQPIAAGSADQFLMHFVPYFVVALGAVAMAGAGSYTFAAFALSASTFWIHVQATLRALTGRRGGFVVTPKQGEGGTPAARGGPRPRHGGRPDRGGGLRPGEGPLAEHAEQHRVRGPAHQRAAGGRVAGAAGSARSAGPPGAAGRCAQPLVTIEGHDAAALRLEPQALLRRRSAARSPRLPAPSIGFAGRSGRR